MVIVNREFHFSELDMTRTDIATADNRKKLSCKAWFGCFEIIAIVVVALIISGPVITNTSEVLVLFLLLHTSTTITFSSTMGADDYYYYSTTTTGCYEISFVYLIFW
jgi:hypothetical protein